MTAFSGDRPPHHASTFEDHDSAESCLGSLLEPHLPEIERWVGSDQRRLTFVGDIGRPAGTVMNLFSTWRSTWVRAILLQGDDAPDGWWLLNGYPTPSIPREDRATQLETPALEHLAGAYFHQDWFEDVGDSDRVVARFVAESPQLAPLLPDEIGALLTELPDDGDVHVHLLDLGCEFRAGPEEGGYTAWLRHVADTVR